VGVKYSNNASTTLPGGISDSATSITVTDASSFPAIASPNYAYLTLVSATALEVVKCTDITGNVLTVIREQEDTDASAFVTDDRVELRVTTAMLTDALAETVAAAAASAAAAATSETNAAASYDNFDDRWLGSKSSDPSVDNDGATLLDGAAYFNTTTNILMVYDLGGTTWNRTTPSPSEQTNIDALAAGAVIADMALLGTTDCVADMAILGTSDTVADMAILATTDIVADMAILGTSDVVTDMNTLGTADVVTDMNVLGTADVVSDMNTLATADIVTDMNLLATSANVTAMGLLGNAATITDLGILGTADVVTDMNVLGTADVVTDMNVLGTADVVTDMNVLGTSGNVTNMNTLSGISANITTVANISADVTSAAAIASDITAVAADASDIGIVAADGVDIGVVAGQTTEIGLLGTSAAVADMALLAIPAVITDMDLLGATGVIADMDSLGATGVIDDLETVANISANVTTCADNLAGINSFANTYSVDSTNPTGGTVNEGDIFFNTSDNQFKYYNGSSWASVTAGIGSLADDGSPELGADLDLNGFDIPASESVKGFSIAMSICL